MPDGTYSGHLDSLVPGFTPLGDFLTTVRDMHPLRQRGSMRTLLSRSLRFARFAIFILALAESTNAFCQNARAASPQTRLLLAIDEGGAASADSAETFRRHEEFSQIVGRVLGSPVTIVAVHDRNLLLDALKKRSYALLLARPNDVPAEAIRDYGYQPVV